MHPSALSRVSSRELNVRPERALRQYYYISFDLVTQPARTTRPMTQQEDEDWTTYLQRIHTRRRFLRADRAMRLRERHPRNTHRSSKKTGILESFFWYGGMDEAVINGSMRRIPREMERQTRRIRSNCKHPQKSAASDAQDPLSRSMIRTNRCSKSMNDRWSRFR